MGYARRYASHLAPGCHCLSGLPTWAFALVLCVALDLGQGYHGMLKSSAMSLSARRYIPPAAGLPESLIRRQQLQVVHNQHVQLTLIDLLASPLSVFHRSDCEQKFKGSLEAELSALRASSLPLQSGFADFHAAHPLVAQYALAVLNVSHFASIFQL